MRIFIFVSIWRKTSQKSDMRENTKPKITPLLNAIDAFTSWVANNNGTRANQARKCRPSGWNESDKSIAETIIRPILLRTVCVNMVNTLQFDRSLFLG